MVAAGRQDEVGQDEEGSRGAVAVAEVGAVPGYDHGVKEAEKRNNETENASELIAFLPIYWHGWLTRAACLLAC